VRPDRVAAAALLQAEWAFVLENEHIVAPAEIRSLVDSKETGCRFCLPTQVLGKLADPKVDALCLQRGDGSGGRWDPRSFAVAVIVPWNRENQNVLGPSGDPYVSNPLRRPRLDEGLNQLSDPIGWGRLQDLMAEIEARNDPAFTANLLRQVLAAVRDRLKELTFVYNLPQRVSLRQAEELTSAFLAESSGGDRGLAVAAALFETIGRRLGIYQEVRRGAINAADAATNASADLECIGKDGGIALAVEVKERLITEADVETALGKARAYSVTEFLLCTEGVAPSEKAAVDRLFTRAWASGTNLYRTTIIELMHAIFPILGEGGIRDFTVEVGAQLDRFSTQPRHRKAWKNLLDGL